MNVYTYRSIMLPKQQTFEHYCIADSELHMLRAINAWNARAPGFWAYYLTPGAMPRPATQIERQKARMVLVDGVYEVFGTRYLPNLMAFLPKPKGDHWSYRIDHLDPRPGTIAPDNPMVCLSIIRHELNDEPGYRGRHTYCQSIDAQCGVDLIEGREPGQAYAFLDRLGYEACLIMARYAASPEIGAEKVRQYLSAEFAKGFPPESVSEIKE